MVEQDLRLQGYERVLGLALMLVEVVDACSLWCTYLEDAHLNTLDHELLKLKSAAGRKQKVPQTKEEVGRRVWAIEGSVKRFDSLPELLL
jgi:hypothetical protein